jgi:hypothetical protein
MDRTPAQRSERGAAALTCVLVALVAFLPFARGVLSGQAFYFRDLSRQFFPYRRFVVEAVLQGHVPYWNPLLHEGEPLSLPPISYPLDLLQLLFSREAGFSLLLALHVPLGALAFFALARGLGLRLAAAAGGSVVYVLGGFYLSMLNLYVYVQAAAWAPLLALALVRSAEGSRRWLAAAALIFGTTLSTTGVEIVLQSALLGLVLALGRDLPKRLAKVGLSLVLGLGLAAPTITVMRSMIGDSARGEGFSTDVVLAHSVHPLTLVQVLVGSFLGDLGNLANRWWGSRFFPMGFPYVLSLYLGATILVIAAVGLLHGHPFRNRVALVGLVALAISVGRWAGLSVVVDALPFLRVLRFPSKAFFTVHVAVALLTAFGLDRLSADGTERAWRCLGRLGIGIGTLLAATPLLPSLLPGSTRWFLLGFLPPSYAWEHRLEVGRAIAADAASGGLLAFAAGALALLVRWRRITPRRGVLLLVMVAAGDLLRTGAGLNPMVTTSFYELSPEMAGVVAARPQGRAFTCDPESSPVYFRARRFRADFDVWTFGVFFETLTPAFNMLPSVPSAYSRDLTMLTPTDRVLAPEETAPGSFAALAERLRGASVGTVISLEPIEHPSLRLRAALTPRRISPLAVHVYDLDGPLPLRAVARTVRPVANRSAAVSAADLAFQSSGGVAVEGVVAATSGAEGRISALDEAPDRIGFVAETNRPTMVVVRDAYARGWSARVNDVEAPVLRANGRHRAVSVPAGTSRVVLSYRPPGLTLGLAIAAASALSTVSIGLVRRSG